MNEDQKAYYYKSTKPFSELVASIENSALKRGFRTLHIHDVQKTLGEKGFVIEPYSIMEVCNASFANSVLGNYKPAGMMLPCRIAVYAEDGYNTVALMKPTMMAQIMPEQDFGDIPGAVERTLAEAVVEAAE